MTVGITGASGYLGSIISNRLAADGLRIVRYVRTAKSANERTYHLEDPFPPDLSGVQLLIHTSYDMRLTSEKEIWQVNVLGTDRLLRAAHSAGVQRVIVVSSMSAYEGTRQLYGRAKLDIESLCKLFGAIILRPGIVIGDGAGGMSGALEKLVRLPITPTILGGRQFAVSEDKVLDVVSVLATSSETPSGPLGLVSAPSVSFTELLRTIAKGCGLRPPRLVPVPWWAVYGALKVAERIGLKVPFRSDSLLGLIHPAQYVPGEADLQEILAAAGDS